MVRVDRGSSHERYRVVWSPYAVTDRRPHTNSTDGARGFGRTISVTGRADRRVVRASLYGEAVSPVELGIRPRGSDVINQQCEPNSLWNDCSGGHATASRKVRSVAPRRSRRLLADMEGRLIGK